MFYDRFALEGEGTANRVHNDVTKPPHGRFRPLPAHFDIISNIMDEQLKALLVQTLTATQPLAEAASVSDARFLVTLLGIYRVSFATLRDIDELASDEGTGPSMLDLARKIMEHGISVEYMILKGKEKMAERFQEYLTVQAHDEIEFFKSIGQDPAHLSPDLQINVADVEKNYAALSKDTRDRKTWAGQSVEGMLADLHKAGALNDFDASRIGIGYVWGSRLNHPNPLVVHGYLEPEEHRLANSFYSRLAILMALSFHLRLATRLIDESRFNASSNIYPEVATEIQAIQTELNTMC